MSVISDLNFGLNRKFRPIIQSEATECGVACIGMIANYFGYRTSLVELRAQFPQSLKGATVAHLVEMADQLKLGTRPVRLELEEVNQLKLPAILHWQFTHFVVLADVKSDHFVIYDPAVGKRRINLNEFSKCFTGVAVEVWPEPSFEEREKGDRIQISSLWGAISGLRRSLFQIFLLAACLEVLGLLVPLFTQWVIDDVLVANDHDLLNVLVVGFLALVIVQQLISVSRYWAVLYFGTTLGIQWKTKVFSHLLRLPAPYFERRHPGDIVSRFGSVDTIQSTVTLSLIAGIIDGCVAVATALLMLIYSPLLTVIPFGFMFAYALGRFLRYRPLREATLEESIHGAKAASHFLESVRGNKTIKLFNRQITRGNSWVSLLVNQINASLKIQKIGIAYHSANSILSSIENILVVWLGAKLAMDGQFTVGFLVAYIAYKNQFDSRITSLIDKYFDFRLLNVQMERLADIVHTPMEGGGASASLREISVSQRAETSSTLELRNVSFRYSPSDPLILSGASAFFEAGESVAIVGPSGIGKSTLVAALLGLHPVTDGEILIGGIPTSELGIDQVRSLIGTVLQDDTLFAGSIEDNIASFDPDMDREWVKECARMARIDLEIQRMPMTYRSLVGDLGLGLSGGQKQRVMLARAFYKRPRILLLDEATSHLDPLNERLINEQIKVLDMTRIVIAHRSETINSADRILELKGGKLEDKELALLGDSANT